MPEPDADDEAHLDELLARFLDDVTAGREPDVAAAAAARPALAQQIRELAEMARQAAPRSKEARPVVGGYEILGELGRGGMGHVHLAQHRALRRRVALKVLPQRMVSKASRERFEREARAVARLEHPGIVRVYEAGEDAGQPWFAMELVPGTTLAAVLHDLRALDRPADRLSGADFARAARLPESPGAARGPTYFTAVAGVIREVAEALAFAHERGVVHRDVKPSNVMLRTAGAGAGRALLFDFGLADVEEEKSLTLSGDFLGTPHYASPEQAAGAVRDLDGRTDVWSLGATLYEMLTLRPPFDGPSSQAILSAITSREPQRPRAWCASIPRDLETICLAALEKDRAKRYRSAADLAADLAAFLDGRPVSARRAGPAERVARWSRRHPAAAAAVVLAALLFAGGPTVLYLQQRDANDAIRSERDKVRDALRVAEDERDSATAVRDFLEELLMSADGGNSGPDVRVADLLGPAAEEAEKRFADRPRIRAEVCAAVAATYGGLSLRREQLELAQRSVVAVESALGRSDRAVLRLREIAAEAMSALGRLDEAAKESEAAWRDAVARFGADADVSIDCGVTHALVLYNAGRAEEAVTAGRELRRVTSSAAGVHPSVRHRVAMNLGLALADTGAREEATELIRGAWEGWSATLGAANGNTLQAAANYAQLLKESGDLRRAEEVLRPTAETARTVLGAADDVTVTIVHNLAGVYLEAGRLDEAAALQQELADVATGDPGMLPGTLSFVLMQLAEIRRLRAEWPAAEAAGLAAIGPSWEAGDTARAQQAADIVARARIRSGRTAAAAEVIGAALDQIEACGCEFDDRLVHGVPVVAKALREAGDAAAADALERRIVK